MNDPSQAEPMQIECGERGKSIVWSDRSGGDGFQIMLFYDGGRPVYLGLVQEQSSAAFKYPVHVARHLRDALIALELGER